MAWLFIGLIIGMLVGRFFKDTTIDEDCPANVYGYDCKGSDVCDHRPSELYRAKMQMALRQEERKDHVNYWKGP